MDTARSLVVKITCGPEALERLNQGWNVAATAAASGVPVSVYLSGDAVLTATPEGTEGLVLPHGTPIADLREAVIATGGEVSVCTQCAARRELTEEDLVEGIAIRGAARFVELVMAPGAQALVY